MKEFFKSCARVSAPAAVVGSQIAAFITPVVVVLVVFSTNVVLVSGIVMEVVEIDVVVV